MWKGLLFSFGALATAMAMIFVDQDLGLWFEAKEQLQMKLAAREVTDIALGEYWFGLAIGVYLFARFWPTRLSPRAAIMTNLRRWSVHLFLGLLGSGILLRIGKWAAGRQRPHRSETLDPFVFDPMTHDWYFHSMPSGHAQVIFSFATTAALLWPRAGWIFYPLAAAIAFTRVMTAQHFVSDIIAGAMIGYFGTLWVRGWLSRKVPVPDPVFTSRENRSDDADRGSRASAAALRG